MSREDGTTFKNQGDCVSYANHPEKGGGNAEAATAAILGATETDGIHAARLQLNLLR